MKAELFWLALTAVMTGLMWIPYVYDRSNKVGLMKSLGNPPLAGFKQSDWGYRLMWAHRNALENLVIFAILVLTLHAVGITSANIGLAAAVYFWARLGHFIVYGAGLAVVRTVIWTVSWLALAYLALALFRLV
jgi:uncharacterized MAPEG superfamily protein